jgi:bacterioferritin-associated ferredoxin
VVICHCKGVTHRCVDRALMEGARTLAQVCRNTGAGQDCGVCVLSVKREIQASASAALAVSGSA